MYKMTVNAKELEKVLNEQFPIKGLKITIVKINPTIEYRFWLSRIIYGPVKYHGSVELKLELVDPEGMVVYTYGNTITLYEGESWTMIFDQPLYKLKLTGAY